MHALPCATPETGHDAASAKLARCRVSANEPIPAAQNASACIKNAMRNGNGECSLAELRECFRDRPDLIFRCYPDAAVPMMRWQCGRVVTDIVELPDGYGVLTEYFELACWAATVEQLIEKLSC
jgi:hypothetical protein